MPKDMPPKDIIMPSFASRLLVDSQDFFEGDEETAQNIQRIPRGIFPSAAKFMPEKALFRTWFHGHTKCVELPLHAFPSQYHSRLHEIQRAHSDTVSSVYHETDNALIHNLLLLTAD